jgi:hypothetical protein
MELTFAELAAESALELPTRALMRHHRRHHHHSSNNGNNGNGFNQSNDNNISNKSQQAVTIAGNNNEVQQFQNTINLIFSNTAGTQQN